MLGVPEAALNTLTVNVEHTRAINTKLVLSK
jgi:hypothetical protein